MINISQPLLNQTGQIRWALNNVASLISPPCSALQQLLTTNGTDFLQGSVVTPNQYNELTPFNSTGLGLQQGDGSPVQIFVTDPKSPQPMPVKPVAGTHLVPLSMGDIVEVIIQNNPANSFNGDYRPAGVNRTAMEQHPMHMHGHHFWVLGYGNGSYISSESNSELNMVNPPMRDTVTVFPGSYTVFRFVADNPGTWLLHCHIFYHQYMGQLLAFYYGLNQLPPPPSTLPTCPASCIYTAAPWVSAINVMLYIC